MNRIVLAGVVSLKLAFLGCASPDEGPEVGESADALGSQTCVGDACSALAQPKPLVRGRLAAVENQLYWLAAGTAVDDTGYPIDELQRCTLPACSNIESLSLTSASGEALHHVGQVHATSSGVVFTAYDPPSSVKSFFLSDGQSLTKLGGTFDSQKQFFSVDEKGLVVYSRAAGSLRYCEFVGNGLSRSCVTTSATNLAHGSDVVLTPTRVALVIGDNIVSVDRATLTDRRNEPGFSSPSLIWVRAIGDRIVGVGTNVTSQNGRASRSTSVWDHDFGVEFEGAHTGDVTFGDRLYVTTMREGDVFTEPGGGVVARISRGGTLKKLATAQNPFGAAVAGSKVYWLNRTSPASVEDAYGEVRFTRK